MHVCTRRCQYFKRNHHHECEASKISSLSLSLCIMLMYARVSLCVCVYVCVCVFSYEHRVSCLASKRTYTHALAHLHMYTHVPLSLGENILLRDTKRPLNAVIDTYHTHTHTPRCLSLAKTHTDRQTHTRTVVYSLLFHACIKPTLSLSVCRFPTSSRKHETHSLSPSPSPLSLSLSLSQCLKVLALFLRSDKLHRSNPLSRRI